MTAPHGGDPLGTAAMSDLFKELDEILAQSPESSLPASAAGVAATAAPELFADPLWQELTAPAAESAAAATVFGGEVSGAESAPAGMALTPLAELLAILPPAEEPDAPLPPEPPAMAAEQLLMAAAAAPPPVVEPTADMADMVLIAESAVPDELAHPLPAAPADMSVAGPAPEPVAASADLPLPDLDLDKLLAMGTPVASPAVATPDTPAVAPVPAPAAADADLPLPDLDLDKLLAMETPAASPAVATPDTPVAAPVPAPVAASADLPLSGIDLDKLLAVAPVAAVGTAAATAAMTARTAPPAGEYDQNDPAACFDEGNAWRAKGAFGRAAECYERAIVLDGRFVKAYCNLAGVLFELGERAAAEEKLRAALKIDPQNSVIKENLAGMRRAERRKRRW